MWVGVRLKQVQGGSGDDRHPTRPLPHEHHGPGNDLDRTYLLLRIPHALATHFGLHDSFIISHNSSIHYPKRPRPLWGPSWRDAGG